MPILAEKLNDRSMMATLGWDSPRGFCVSLPFALIWLVLALLAPSPAAESWNPASSRLLLERALNAGVVTESDLTLLDAGLRCEVLVRFGRLLPAEFSVEEKKALAAALLHSETEADDSLQRRLARFPGADDLVFDGQHYSGGNFSYIDSILGPSGRPIAFDREPPALLVPLEQEAETSLLERRAAYLKNPASLMARQQADVAYGAGSASLMFSDGQFLRPYAGRFDDLYFHLFQNGNGASGLAFEALSEGLGRRTYQTVNGLCLRANVTAKGVDLDDILADGGKTAVHRYLRGQAASAPTPFQGFAFRLLPGIVGKAGRLPAGARFTATNEEILRAFRKPQHLYPTSVPPLYRLPNRFLGWSGSLLVPVANRVAMPAGVADSWYPLPGRASQAMGESAEDGAASAQLFDPSDSSIASPEAAVQSSSAGDVVWEDPVDSKLLADPGVNEDGGLVEVRPALPVNPPSTTAKANGDPRLKPASIRLIAVVMPTVDEAKAYRAAMAASDDEIRAIEQARGRLGLLQQSIATAARTIVKGANAGGLDEAIQLDLASLVERERLMTARLQTALVKRHELRVMLENRLRDECAAPLLNLGRKAETADESRSGRLL